MLNWHKEYAGCYVTQCGTFKVSDIWHTASGSKRIWSLWSNDSRYTLEEPIPEFHEGRAVVDSFNTLADAKYYAGIIQSERLTSGA